MYTNISKSRWRHLAPRCQKREIIHPMTLPTNNDSESGKVHVKVFWKTGLIISIILSVVGTIILNLVF